MLQEVEKNQVGGSDLSQTALRRLMRGRRWTGCWDIDAGRFLRIVLTPVWEPVWDDSRWRGHRDSEHLVCASIQGCGDCRAWYDEAREPQSDSIQAQAPNHRHDSCLLKSRLDSKHC